MGWSVCIHVYVVLFFANIINACTKLIFNTFVVIGSLVSRSVVLRRSLCGIIIKGHELDCFQSSAETK